MVFKEVLTEGPEISLYSSCTSNTLTGEKKAI